MAYKMTKSGKVVRISFCGKLSKAFIKSVDNNPKGDQALERAVQIIKDSKVTWDFSLKEIPFTK